MLLSASPFSPVIAGFIHSGALRLGVQVLWRLILCVTSCFLLFPLRVSLLGYTCLCLWCRVPWSSSFLFSGVPRHLEHYGSCQRSRTGETEASPSGWLLPPKARTLDLWSRLVFPFPGRRWELGVPSNHVAQCQGRDYSERMLQCSHSFRVAHFMLTWGAGHS